MKLIYNYIVILVIASFFMSCEEVVNVKLNSAEPRLVIDGSITSGEPCLVFLSMTQSFHDNGAYKRISGATIELTDDTGNREILVESINEKGAYFSAMLGEANKKYHLKVLVEKGVYEASATIPVVVPIDSIYIYNIRVGKENWYSPTVIFDDPAGIENYYYSSITLNSKLLNTIYLDDDEFQDGVKEVHNILFYDSESNNDEDIKLGDEITVNMQTLDKGMYTFYKSIFSVAAGGATNPITNFSGDVLGCFKAYSSSSKTIIVSESHIYTKN